ncbi:MAG TPA: 5-formyltetrahydrofolate cyclo-ligase [Aquella sp.]|nr:5-formyltetrahydrofolate cyclo-ligase [Aquella sp.]
MKQPIRDQIKLQLKTYTVKVREDAANNLLINLKPLLDNASTIAVYHAHGYELNLNNVIDYCVSNEKKLYQPLSYKHSKHMVLTKYNANYPQIFSEKEFVPETCFEWYNLDLILLPLIAVDKLGFRLGKGGGYYDTTLMDMQNNTSGPILCGVGFDSQLIEHVPKNDWDTQLDYFASEKQLIKF